MATTDIDQPMTGVKIPRPRPNCTYTVESLGRIVDRLMGDRSIEARTAEHLEPLIARDEGSESEPKPVEIPEPRPNGSEDITKGGRPSGETRSD